MKAIDAVNATASVLSRMSPNDRAAVARVLTMPGAVEAITQQAIYDDVKAIATRSVNAYLRPDVKSAIDDLLNTFRRAGANS